MTKLAGRYQLLEKIGEGGFGITYLAIDHHHPSHRKCVVKQLQPQHRFSADQVSKVRQFFKQEAVTLERLGKHFQIPQLLAYFEENGDFFIVQEWVDGQTLRQKLEKHNVLREEDVISLLEQGLEVLSFVHQQGVIHRDIKPENLIIRPDGALYLIDFDAVKEFSATRLASNPQVTTTVCIGTLGYMPDEQQRGQPRPASDIYALGMVAIEALTGQNPSTLDTDPNTGEVIWRKQGVVNSALAGVLDKMVRHHYSRRYSVGQHALSALRREVLVTGRTVSANSTSTSAKTQQPRVKSSNTQLAGSLIEQNIFTQSPWRFALLLITTWGFYLPYWYYKVWRTLNLTKSSAIVRSILTDFLVHSASARFYSISKKAKPNYIQEPLIQSIIPAKKIVSSMLIFAFYMTLLIATELEKAIPLFDSFSYPPYLVHSRTSAGFAMGFFTPFFDLTDPRAMDYFAFGATIVATILVLSLFSFPFPIYYESLIIFDIVMNQIYVGNFWLIWIPAFFLVLIAVRPHLYSKKVLESSIPSSYYHLQRISTRGLFMWLVPGIASWIFAVKAWIDFAMN